MGACFSGSAPKPAPLPSADLAGIAEYLGSTARRVVVMAGAGISTSAGIPDFRSPGTGLYSKLQKYELPRPEAIFDLKYFKRNPAPFYDLVQELWPGLYRPTPSHWFLRLLSDRGLLLRCYTQNIDSLESLAGLPEDKLVAAHGNFDACHVVGGRSAGKSVPTEELRAALGPGGEGWQALAERHGGLVKPNIVFFGENLPGRFTRLQYKDFDACDLLIVMGTSLQVQPFAGLAELPRQECPRVLINRERVGRDFDFGGGRDVFLGTDCDAAVMELCGLLCWRDELLRLCATPPPGASS